MLVPGPQMVVFDRNDHGKREKRGGTREFLGEGMGYHSFFDCVYLLKEYFWV